MNIAPDYKNKIVYLSDNEADFGQKFSKYIHYYNIIKLNEEFTTALKHIERNGYDKLVFLDLALKTTKLLKVKPQ